MRSLEDVSLCTINSNLSVLKTKPSGLKINRFDKIESKLYEPSSNDGDVEQGYPKHFEMQKLTGARSQQEPLVF